ncbi:MAG TPA: ester cyclase [Candidatus Nitrosocosmicus sp.]|jgi:predicted ester cyclase|nr:ester cyclase [Candidatus Nitrosocosmicus sp.]
MSSIEELRETVKNLVETFNDPQRREISYFDFYDESLRTYGFPQHLSDDKEGFKQFIYLLWNAFPDIRIIFEDVIIEGNKIAGRYRLEGTHKGKFLDLQPTNKQFKVNGTTIFYFQDSKCVKRWNLVDMISLMDQLKN